MALTYPLITVSLRCQIEKGTKDQTKGQMETFETILKEEGFGGLYS